MFCIYYIYVLCNFAPLISSQATKILTYRFINKSQFHPKPYLTNFGI